MKKYKIVFTILLITVTLLCTVGCGKQTKVPDGVIQMYSIEQCDYYDSSAKCDWTATHKVNKDAHSDTVSIKMDLEYEYGTMTTENTITYRYDKSADLWMVWDWGEWSDPTYSYNDNLEGEWSLVWFDSSYDINITDVNGDLFSVECYADEDVYGGLFEGNVRCKMYSEGVFSTYGDDVLEIPLELPDDFFVSWRYTSSGENENTTYLNVQINLIDGLKSAYISPKIDMWSK